MKVVFLLAGKGRRLGDLTSSDHKSLIKLDQCSLLHHLIENCIYAGLNDFIPIVGHCSEKVLSCFGENYSEEITVTPVTNKKYNETNNLYSLYCAREFLEGEEFILCNGDIIVDRDILKSIAKQEGKSAIAIDDFDFSIPVDSPGVTTLHEKITDLGRHISFDDKSGYAIGVYKFSKKLSKRFFKEAEKLLIEDINAGFHDPLCNLFDEIDIFKHRTEGGLWTDIDTEEDIARARDLHRDIIKGY